MSARIAVIEPQPNLAEHFRRLVRDAGYISVGPNEDPDLRILCVSCFDDDERQSARSFLSDMNVPVLVIALERESAATVEFALNVRGTLIKPFARDTLAEAIAVALASEARHEHKDAEAETRMLDVDAAAQADTSTDESVTDGLMHDVAESDVLRSRSEVDVDGLTNPRQETPSGPVTQTGQNPYSDEEERSSGPITFPFRPNLIVAAKAISDAVPDLAEVFDPDARAELILDLMRQAGLGRQIN